MWEAGDKGSRHDDVNVPIELCPNDSVDQELHKYSVEEYKLSKYYSRLE